MPERYVPTGAFFASEHSEYKAVLSHRHVNELLANQAYLHLTGTLLDFRNRDFDFIIITDDETALKNLVNDAPRRNKPLAPIFYFGSTTDEEKITSIAQKNSLSLEYFPIMSASSNQKMDDTIPIHPLHLAITNLLGKE